MPTERSPFLFSQVRATNWSIWAFNSVDGFNVGRHGDGRLCDGITVRDGSNDVVFVHVAAGRGAPETRCPCDMEFQTAGREEADLNFKDSGTAWMCQQVTQDDVWERLFVKGPVCKPNVTGSSDWFTLKTPQRFLRIGLCRDQGGNGGGGDDEDLKLASGELFVRKTADFDAAVHCPPRTPDPSLKPDASLKQEKRDDARWIAPTVVAVVAGALLLVVSAALIRMVCLSKKRAPAQRESEYGSVLGSLS